MPWEPRKDGAIIHRQVWATAVGWLSQLSVVLVFTPVGAWEQYLPAETHPHAWLCVSPVCASWGTLPAAFLQVGF